MGRRQMAIVLPHLVDNGGDLSKDWFVEYSVRDPYTGNMKRFREYSGFKNWNLPKNAMSWPILLLRNCEQKMEEGWSPFGREKVTYEDALLCRSMPNDGAGERVCCDYPFSPFRVPLRKNSVTEKSYQTYRSKLHILRMDWAMQAWCGMWVSSARTCMWVPSLHCWRW